MLLIYYKHFKCGIFFSFNFVKLYNLECLIVEIIFSVTVNLALISKKLEFHTNSHINYVNGMLIFNELALHNIVG